jgi:hypothetical protein
MPKLPRLAPTLLSDRSQPCRRGGEHVDSWHIAAHSQSGSMSAAGESRLCIVIATVVREGQRIAELEAEIEALQRQALALGAEPTADVPPWVCSE